MATITIRYREGVTLQRTYTINSNNRHYAGSGGGPMSPSFYGTEVETNFETLTGLKKGFIRLPYTTKNSSTILPLMEVFRRSDNYEYGSKEIIPINTDIKIHKDWVDRSDRIRTTSIVFEYSEDQNSWEEFTLVITVPDQVTSYSRH